MHNHGTVVVEPGQGHAAVARWRAAGETREITAAVRGLVWCDYSNADWDAAAVRAQDAMDLARIGGRDTDICEALAQVATLEGARGHTADALAHSAEALRLAQALDSPYLVAEALCRQLVATLSVGDAALMVPPAEALSQFVAADRVAASQPEYFDAAVALALAGRKGEAADLLDLLLRRGGADARLECRAAEMLVRCALGPDSEGLADETAALALRLEGHEYVFCRARVELFAGAMKRRLGHRLEARALLLPGCRTRRSPPACSSRGRPWSSTWGGSTASSAYAAGRSSYACCSPAGPAESVLPGFHPAPRRGHRRCARGTHPPSPSQEVPEMNRRHVFAVTLLTTTLGLTACSAAASGTGTGIGSGVPSGEAGSTAPASSPTPTATPTPTTGNGGGVTLASGSCSTIDQQTAADILGFPTPPGTEASKAGAGSEGFKKIEGCSYRSATQGSMGYDVVQVSAALGPQLIAAAKARMKAAGSAIVIFEVGMPDSFGFTQRLGKLVDSQVTVLAGDHFITVAVARKDGEAAKYQASAIAAAQKLASG